MFETNFDERNSISAGFSLNYDYFNQTYRLENDDTGDVYKRQGGGDYPVGYLWSSQ